MPDLRLKHDLLKSLISNNIINTCQVKFLKCENDYTKRLINKNFPSKIPKQRRRSISISTPWHKRGRFTQTMHSRGPRLCVNGQRNLLYLARQIAKQCPVCTFSLRARVYIRGRERKKAKALGLINAMSVYKCERCPHRKTRLIVVASGDSLTYCILGIYCLESRGIWCGVFCLTVRYDAGRKFVLFNDFFFQSFVVFWYFHKVS